MSFFLVFAFFCLVISLAYLARISPPIDFDQELLPDFVRQLAREAYLEGRIVMGRNDKRQIESFTGKPWSKLNFYELNSIWLNEMDRLKELNRNNDFYN